MNDLNTLWYFLGWFSATLVMGLYVLNVLIRCHVRCMSAYESQRKSEDQLCKLKLEMQELLESMEGDYDDYNISTPEEAHSQLLRRASY